MSTLTVYPDANPESTSVDGTVGRHSVDETFSTIRNGAGTLNTPSSDQRGPIILASSTLNQYAYVERLVLLFDTSPLGASAVISAATLSIYAAGKSNNLGADNVEIVTSDPASNTNLTGSTDYPIANWGTTSLATGIALSAISTGAYNDFALNASGLAVISLTAISKFGSRLGKDISGAAPTWLAGQRNELVAALAETAGTSSDPKLVITYTTPYTKNFTDTVTVSDSLLRAMTRNFSEGVSVSDNITKAIIRIFSEDAISLSEVFSKVHAHFQSFSDSITITDSGIIKAITRVFSESVSISDSISKRITKIFSDSVSITDSIVKLLYSIGAGIPDLVSGAIRSLQNVGRGLFSSGVDKPTGIVRNTDKPKSL